MATQARRMSAPMVLPNESSGSIFTQVIRVFVQPQAFFKALPANHQWLIAALLVLVIAGYTATTQTQSSSTTSTTNTTTTVQTATFDLSTLSQTTTGANTAQSTTATTPAATATATTVSSETILTNALLAAGGILLMWGGEAIFLSLVCMMRGYAPKIGKSFQIAVWASLPLALMLIARYAYYANGGTGGALGLSLLLTQWSGYSALPVYARRVVALFMSNLTLFWLWNLLLLYLGARYALGGRRLMVIVVIALWIAASTLIPAFVSDPTTRTTPRQTTSQTAITPQTNTQSTNNSTTTTTTQQSNTTGGGNFPGGGGAPPNGGFPGGGG